MSGHSKWSTIKHKKGKTDAQRGKIFSKFSREIMVAAKEGGGDESMNARLRLIVQKAKAANMPNDNIKRAVQKGTGGGSDANLDAITFEAYAPDGVALLIDCLTDNKNRTITNIKIILNKAGANMAEKGAVSYMFEKKGTFLFPAGSSEEKIMEAALEGGAQDVVTHTDGSVEVICLLADFDSVRSALEAANLKFESAEIIQDAETKIALETEESARKILTLVDKLEDDDDVQAVFGNFDIPESILNALDH